MKVRIEYISEGENEILIRCDKINDEILEILDSSDVVNPWLSI